MDFDVQLTHRAAPNLCARRSTGTPVRPPCTCSHAFQPFCHFTISFADSGEAMPISWSSAFLWVGGGCLTQVARIQRLLHAKLRAHVMQIVQSKATVVQGLLVDTGTQG